jgi:hypothetical protein
MKFEEKNQQCKEQEEKLDRLEKEIKELVNKINFFKITSSHIYFFYLSNK